MNNLISEDIQSFVPADLGNLTDSFSAGKETLGCEKYIVFQLDEKRYAVSARQVVEVIQPLPVTFLPKSPVWLSGIINLRGRIISVIDLPKLWENQISFSSSKSKLIILRSVNSENYITFAVDRLNEIAAFPADAIQAVKPTDLPYLLGKINYKSEDLHMLDTDKIYSYICFCLETGH